MSDFNIRSGSVDVEQIMRQIRARIREKRGVDYSEQEIRELASVKLEKFLDPKNVRSDLLDYYRKKMPGPPMPPMPPPLLPLEVPQSGYSFEADTIYVSSRGVVGRLLQLTRRVLNPLLKLFFNPNPIIHALHLQARLNAHLIENLREFTSRYEGRYEAQLEWVVQRFKIRDELDALNYEVLNNLVVELTRLGIDVKNLKMRVESLSSRIDFDERRGRALEGVVQYRPPAPTPPGAPSGPVEAGGPEGPGEGQRRRRRRRRGRRRGGSRPAEGTPESTVPQDQSAAPPSDEPETGGDTGLPET